MREVTSPHRWCDLGDSLLIAKQVDAARRCYRQAESLGPLIPPVLLRVAGFYLYENDRQRALACVSKILHEAPMYWESIFAQYGLFGQDFLRYGMPEETGPAAAYLRYAIRAQDRARAAGIWTWVNAHKLDDDTLANEYAVFLLDHRQYREAADAWAQHAGKGSEYRASNWIYNGGFESEPGGRLFDWRVTPVKNVEVQTDYRHPFAGKRALRITFEQANNALYSGVAQTAVAGPGTWRFEAHIRTEGVPDDQGFAFHLFDKLGPRRLDVHTNFVKGLTPWTTLEKTFRLSEPVTLLEAMLERAPSFSPDDRMRGSAWIDGVILRRVE